MKLFRIKLTDPFVLAGNTRTVNTYIVMAKDSREAEKVLREESPSAFLYNPTIDITIWPGRSAHFTSMRVKQPRKVAVLP